MLIKQLKNGVRLFVRKSPLVGLLRKIFRKKPHDEALQVGRQRGWSAAAEWMLSAKGESLLENDKFHYLFRHDINKDIEGEFLLTAMRRYILLSNNNFLNKPVIIHTIATLIIQAHFNEFVWYVSSEEEIKIKSILNELQSIETPTDDNFIKAVLLLMYSRLGYTKDLSFAQHCRCLAKQADNYKEINKLTRQYKESFEEEQRIKKDINAFDQIENTISQKIAANYEEYPYPRWLMWDFPVPGTRIKKLETFFNADELEFSKKDFNILVAGCGTGSKVIEYAIGYGDRAKITAIDLSRASLAYAIKMARKNNLHNIDFIQMDLLKLPELDKTFDIVECTGVLHHMLDPLLGGRAIIDRVRENGLVHISLYSDHARQSIVHLRKKYNLDPESSNDEIRLARKIMMEKDADTIDNRLSLRWDFFDLVRCKDLLFHPLEHRYTLPEIPSFLDALHLEFRGLEKPDLDETKYWTHYPADNEIRDIDKWDKYELRHPNAFGGLYEIWSIKRAD